MQNLSIRTAALTRIFLRHEHGQLCKAAAEIDCEGEAPQEAVDIST